MIPWDWIGIVTIRSETRRSTSITGTIMTRPGFLSPTTRPSRKSTPSWYCCKMRSDSARATRMSTAMPTSTASRICI
jgi:hypothetical protein